MATDAQQRGSRGGDQQVSASKLSRVYHAHDAPLPVENRHGRDEFLTLRETNSVRWILHVSCLPSRKRATDAHVPLPQAGHGSVPISKQASQSRHTAIRRSGRYNVRSTGPSFILSGTLSRRGTGNPNLWRAVLSGPANVVFKALALSALKTPSGALGIRSGEADRETASPGLVVGQSAR